ncbi:MAG: hypothetical protein M5U08_07365 [Burkholderiales bacterium]|nr:hypothetical protein [Burkholderiales bacterium]
MPITTPVITPAPLAGESATDSSLTSAPMMSGTYDSIARFTIQSRDR